MPEIVVDDAQLRKEELASRAGLHPTYLSDLERGEQTPTLDVVNRIGSGVGVTLAEFFAPFEEPYRVRFRKRRRDVPPRRTDR